jgi:hypothetical protein
MTLRRLVGLRRVLSLLQHPAELFLGEQFVRLHVRKGARARNPDTDRRVARGGISARWLPVPRKRRPTEGVPSWTAGYGTPGPSSRRSISAPMTLQSVAGWSNRHHSAPASNQRACCS